MRDRAKVLKYIESTNSKYRNEKELVLKLARIFKIDYSYVWQILANLKKENPKLLRLNSNNRERQERDHSGFRRLSYQDKGIIVFEPKEHVINVPHITEPKSATEKETVNIKDMKPIDGIESVWKEGKMRPVEQKNYRGSFQDKD